MPTQSREISSAARISLPSKGRLSEDAMAFLADCGLSVDRPNPRQYEAAIPALPDLKVLFQRPADIVVSVRDGSVDFGITGLDVVAERQDQDGSLLVLHDALGFGGCSLRLAVPEAWPVQCVADLRSQADELGHPLRVATKYPNLTGRFLSERSIPHVLIAAEGTLETAPAIGYADLLCDIVSSGQTLRDNRLRPLPDGVLLTSQAALVANRRALVERPAALSLARDLLEYFEARLRGNQNLAIFANMRGNSPQEIADRIFEQSSIHGLQGPTVSQVIVRETRQNWYAVNLVVPRSDLLRSVRELRSIGGSGVVVLPASYIFDEEPPRITAMLRALANGNREGALDAKNL